MQSEQYFNLLCTVVSSLWFISIAGVTNLQTSAPVRSSEHSPSPCYEDVSRSPRVLQGLCFVDLGFSACGVTPTRLLSHAGFFWLVCFLPGDFRVTVTQWNPKGKVKKMTLSAMMERYVLYWVWSGAVRREEDLLMNSERRSRGCTLHSVLIRQHFHMSHNR